MKSKGWNRADGLISIGLAVLILIIQWMGLLNGAENRLQDFHYQKGGLINPDIYVIGIDEETLMEYGPWQNWSREKIANLIKLLNQDADTAPAVIGLDIGFFGETDSETDRLLAEAALSGNNIVATSYATFGKQIIEEHGAFHTEKIVTTYEEPYNALKTAVSYGYSNVPLDPDGIARHSLCRIPIDNKTTYSFAVELYRKYMGELPRQAEAENAESYIPFSGQPFDYYGSETAGLSLSKVLSGEVPREMFAGAIVLVGAYSTGMMDSYYTSISHSVPMFGVEVHANILQALLEDNVKQELPLVQSLLITMSFILMIYLCRFLKDMRLSTLAVVFIGVLYWIAAGWCYEKGSVMPLLHPLLAGAILYVYQVGQRYLMERASKKHLEKVFGKYVPKQVVSGIVKGGEDALKLGGQKRDIAVLFVDIRGFTPLSESLQPEQVVDILNLYLDLTTKSIFKNDGMVDKFIGDATMGVYNAPLDLDDYVFKAVKTGLDMVAGSKDLEQKLAEITDKKVGFGIGINCGEAVIGNIGTKQRMEYTAIGNTVNTAARLESQAKAGEVIISQEVYLRIKDRISATCLGERTLKGIAKDAVVYRVESILNPGDEVKG
ncbi:MAG: adenylate/guanylate cyclase domain-containing protein [Clostridium sp.]